VLPRYKQLVPAETMLHLPHYAYVTFTAPQTAPAFLPSALTTLLFFNRVCRFRRLVLAWRNSVRTFSNSFSFTATIVLAPLYTERGMPASLGMRVLAVCSLLTRHLFYLAWRGWFFLPLRTVYGHARFATYCSANILSGVLERTRSIFSTLEERWNDAGGISGRSAGMAGTYWQT